MHQSTRPTPMLTVQKVVNPLGTVTTITKAAENEFTEMSESAKKECDLYLHENCDEALFRPVVTVHGSQKMDEEFDSLSHLIEEFSEENAASLMNAELIVPVIEEKNLQCFNKNYNRRKAEAASSENLAKFEELSSINKKSKKPKFSEHDVTEKIVKNEEIVNIEPKMEEKSKEPLGENRKNEKIVKKKEILGENRKGKKTDSISVKLPEKTDEIVVEKSKENGTKNKENSKNRKKSKEEAVFVKNEKILEEKPLPVVEKFEEIPIEAKEMLKSEIAMEDVKEKPSKNKKIDKSDEKCEEFMEISVENIPENINEFEEIYVESTENVTEKNMIAKSAKNKEKSKNYEEKIEEFMEISAEKIADFVEVSVKNTEIFTEKIMATKPSKNREVKKPKNDELMEVSVENVEEKIADFVKISIENTAIVTEKNKKKAKVEEICTKSDEKITLPEQPIEKFEEIPIEAKEMLKIEITMENDEKPTKTKKIEKSKNEEFTEISTKLTEFKNPEIVTEKNNSANDFVEIPQETKTNNNNKKEQKNNNKKYNKRNNRKSPDYEAEIMAEIDEIKKCDEKLVTEPVTEIETNFEVKKDMDCEIDFPEPELPPLEPFCTKTMEQDISFDDCASGAECVKTENDDKISIIMEELKKKRAFDEKNFIFAMCSSLKEDSCEEEEENNSIVSKPTIEKTLSIEDSDYKSLEMEMEENPTNDKNVSEEEDESSSSNANTNNDDEKIPSSDDNQQEQEDDEELQPLIRRESFQTGDDSRYDDSSSMAAEYPPLTPFDMPGDELASSLPSAKAMLNTLPDNSNQSDNSNKCVNVKQIINNNKKKSKKKRK